MNPNRKHWNQQQSLLRKALSRSGDHASAVTLFLSQHAMVHSASMSHSGLFSFADEVCQDMGETALRRIPRSAEHSVAWILWHLARIEDVTMNVLAAGEDQVLRREAWLERLNVTTQDTGNVTDPADVAQLSAAIDLDALLAYRTSVGRSTRALVARLQPQDLRQKVSPARLQRLLDEGAVRASALELLDYWGNLTLGGLLLMPPTRHNFIHLNEALRIKEKLS